MAKTGLDTDFGCTQNIEPIRESHYVMFSSIAPVRCTMGGVEINEKAQVLNMAGNPIPNLYAAAEVTGGIHENNRFGTLSIPDTVTFGHIAAQTCWKENHKKLPDENKKVICIRTEIGYPNSFCRITFFIVYKLTLYSLHSLL